MTTFNNKQFNYKKESNEDTNQQGLNSTCSEEGVLELNKLLDFIESRTSVKYHQCIRKMFFNTFIL